MAIEGFRIMDNHFHLREDGMFIDAVKIFRKAGGDIINLVNLPDHSLPPDNYYEKIYERTLRIAEAVRSNTDVDVLLTLGPYPLDYFYFRDNNLDPVKEMTHGIDMLGKYCDKNLISAIGEIGRPHFEVPDQVMKDSNLILEHGLRFAADREIPAILHTEDLDERTMNEIKSMAINSGMKPSMVIKHHASIQNVSKPMGITQSILATRPNLRGSIETKNLFLLETDYVDDPQKPGKVIAPDSVPRRALLIKGEYGNNEKILSDIFQKLPSMIYGKEHFEA